MSARPRSRPRRRLPPACARGGLAAAALAAALAASAPAPARAWSWELAPTSGEAPPPAFGHTLTRALIAGTPAGVLCGGYDARNTSLISGCYAFEPPAAPGGAWAARRVIAPGVAYPRAGHASVAFGDFIFLLGGNTTDPEPTNPEVFNVGTWAHVPGERFDGAVPPARSEMAAALFRGRYWLIHGGVSLEDSSDLADAALLDMGDGVNPVFNWSAVAPTNGGPGARHGHAAAAWGTDAVLFVGGRTEAGGVLNDVWSLTYGDDRGTWTWRQRSTPGGEPRAGGAAAVVGDFLVYYGGTSGRAAGGAAPAALPPAGVRVLNLRTFVWTVPEAAGAWLRLPLLPAVALFPPAAAAADAAAAAAAAGDAALAVVGGVWDSDVSPDSGPPPPAGSGAGVVAVLTGIGVDPAPAPALGLAGAIGGGACGLFAVLVGVYLGAQACHHRSPPPGADDGDAAAAGGGAGGGGGSGGGAHGGDGTPLLSFGEGGGGGGKGAALLPRLSSRQALLGGGGGGGGGADAERAHLRQLSLLQRGGGGIQMAAMTARLRAGAAAAVAAAAAGDAGGSDGSFSPAGGSFNVGGLSAPLLLASPGSARYGAVGVTGGAAGFLADSLPVPHTQAPLRIRAGGAGSGSSGGDRTRGRSASSGAVLRGAPADGRGRSPIPEGSTGGETSSYAGGGASEDDERLVY